MHVLFIESHKFAEQIARLNAEEAVWELESELMQNPDNRRLIQGRFSQNLHEIAGKRRARRSGGLVPPERSRRRLSVFPLYQERTERPDRRTKSRVASAGALFEVTMKKKPLEIEFDGEELVAAVQETVKLYREGRLGELRTRERKPLKPLKPAQIRAIRKKWGASQAIFANVLNVPKKTYIWESDYKNPSGAH